MYNHNCISFNLGQGRARRPAGTTTQRRGISMPPLRSGTAAFAIALAAFSGSTAADPAKTNESAATAPYYIAPSISPEAHALLEKMLPLVIQAQAARPVAHSAADFQARRTALLQGGGAQ